MLVPFAWDNWKRDDPPTAVFHDEHDHRVRDVGGPGSPDWAAHVQGAQAGGDRRRAAADLRRADPRAVAPAASGGRRRTTPRRRRCTGCCCTTGPDLAPQQVKVPDDATALAAFTARAARSSGGHGCRGGARAAAGALVAGGPAGAARCSPRHVRPFAGHRLAADLLHRAHLGRARAAARQRAGERAEGRRDRPRGGAGRVDAARRRAARRGVGCGTPSPAARRSARWCTPRWSASSTWVTTPRWRRWSARRSRGGRRSWTRRC